MAWGAPRDRLSVRLAERMGINRVTWAEQEGGIRHHLSVLMPCLTAAARRQFEAAMTRLSAMHVARGDA